MTKLSKTEVPLVQDDLKYPETIIQIANTLDILDQAVKHVFAHVNKSIGKTRQKLQNIEQRNNVVGARIEQLRNIQKSVTVISKSKYPYIDHENFVVNYQALPKPELSKLPSGIGALDTRSGDSIDSKLKFYHVKTGEDMLHRNVDLVSEECLGRLPQHIESITSCMLFNTCENVYDKYVIVDPLSSKQITKPSVSGKEDTVLKMEDAPKSLLQEDDLLVKKQTYVYSPSVEDVPVIDLPMDLPDLMGFADDFRYTGDNIETPRIVGVPTSPPMTEIPVASTPPPPQPTNISQRPSPVPTPTPVVSSKVEATLHPVAPPPPPPPPPPIEPSSPPPPEVSSSLHANLMQAIRNAGGSGKAKLRAVDGDSAAAMSAPAPAPSGDLMSDLAAKLSLRRKGISGTKESPGGGSLMDKLLLNIPPPPMQGGGVSSSGSEEEEENEAEWDD